MPQGSGDLMVHRWNCIGVYRKSTEPEASRTYPRRIRRVSRHRLSSRQDYSGPSVTETTYYIGGVLEKVCVVTACASGTVDWRHSIVAEGKTVAIVSRKSTSVNAVNYPLGDSQGSGSTLTNSSGTLLTRQSYNAFGKQRDGDDWDGDEQSGDLTTMEGISRRGYTGHSMLGRMGLIHMNGRVQDAITGRFLSPDPNVPDPGFTQSYNRYAYVRNNPMSYTDPSGFCEVAANINGECRFWVDGNLMTVAQAQIQQQILQYQHQLESYGEGTCEDGSGEICGLIQRYGQALMDESQRAQTEAWIQELHPDPIYITIRTSAPAPNAAPSGEISYSVGSGRSGIIGRLNWKMDTYEVPGTGLEGFILKIAYSGEFPDGGRWIQTFNRYGFQELDWKKGRAPKPFYPFDASIDRRDGFKFVDTPGYYAANVM